MKNLKKLSGILLAIAVLLACTVSAFATSGVRDDNNGKITIKNTVKDETYSIYRIFDLESFNTAPNTGVDPAYSYRVNSDWNDFINQATIKGVYVDVDGNGYVTWKESADQVEFAAKAIAYAQAEATKITPAEGYTKQSLTNGSDVVFENLPLGYYLVDSTVGTLCALTTTNLTVDVIEKNPRPVLTKEVQEGSNWGEANDAKLGDTVKFKATINVFGYIDSYVMHDEMADGFTFEAISSIIKNPGENQSPLTENTDYELKTADIDPNCDFEIVFQNSFLNGLKSGDVIVVEYTAKLNTDATIGNTGNLNKAYLSYKDYNGDSYSTTPDETKTYTWNIPVLKYANGDPDKVLPGATFALYSNEEATDVIKLIKVGSTGTTYRVATQKEIDDNAASIIESITTDATGKFNIQGLDSGTYYLKETVAPTGYNKLNTLVTVNIANNGNITLGADDTVVPEVQVNNNSGSILPETGGIGTTIFYIVGGVLVAAAVVLLVAKKRTSENR